MASTVTIDLRHVARGLDISLHQIQAVVELLDDGNTVPFITRYRKDQTGGLDEEQIRQIQDRLAKTRQLSERKQTILRSIEAQGKLTEKLAKQIHAATTTKRLEDLYLPYKPKKQTLATVARSRGLEELAREILDADPLCADLDARAADFVNTDRQIPTAADALLGAGHILAEQFSERADLRQRLREILQRSGTFVSTRIGGDAKEGDARDNVKAAVKEQPQAGEPTKTDVSAAESSHSETVGAPHEPAVTVTETTVAAIEIPAELIEIPPESVETPAESVETPAEPVETPAEPVEKLAEPVEMLAESVKMPAEPVETLVVVATPVVVVETPDAATLDPPPDESSAAVVAELPVEVISAHVAAAVVESDGSPALPAVAAHVAPVPTAPSVAKKAKAARQQAAASKKDAKKQKLEERKIKAFRDYFEYREEIKKIPAHRILAINRGEREKVLRVKIESDFEAMQRAVDESAAVPEHPHAAYLCGCGRDALARLILPSLEREARRELTDRAELHAVKVFARNLRNLLLQPPIRDRRVLAVDPGFRSGCKLAALDQFGNMLEHGVIYLVGRSDRRKAAQQKVADLVDRFQLSVVVIGNGTACRECEDFFVELISGDLKDRGLAYVIVNEAGASVYSTSPIGRDEFPNYDASLRGAISIGRRLQDPLSELVKIDAANIGVGLYQHDVRAKHLSASLDEVVESCVNYVGVDVNSASPALLRYVSGLNQLTARRVYEYRCEHGPFRSRNQLRDVPGFGEATFVQSAGFLKIQAGDDPLDGTWIHPESYAAAARLLDKLGHSPADLPNKESAAALAGRIAGLDLEALAQELQIGTLTLKDIAAQLVRPGRDPREDLPTPVFKKGVLKLEDLTPGMELTGTVLNVVDFGAFVDIGMHDSGLVHVSQLADQFVRDAHEVVAVGDIVKVWVLQVDKERRRVSLSMVKPGSERPRPEHRDSRSGRPRSGQGRGRPEGATVGPPVEGQAAGDASTQDQAAASEAGSSDQNRPARDQRERSGQSRPRQGGGRPEQGRSSGGQGGQRSRESRPPRSDGPPRGKGPGRRDYGPPKPKYEPKPAPKPVVPLTKAMKSGKAPLRTFGDLAQFYDLKHGKTEQEQASHEKPPRIDPPVPELDTPATATAAAPESAPPVADQQEAMPPTAIEMTVQQEAMPPSAIDRPVEVQVEQVGPPPVRDDAAANVQESAPAMEPRPDQGHDEPTA